MTDSHDELLSIANEIENLATLSLEPEISEPLDRLKQAAEDAGKAWSGSWIGYHANVYYTNLQIPPPGKHFNPEWGSNRTPLVQDAETDGWAIHDPDNVSRMIHERAGNPDLDPAKNFNGFAKAQFKKQKSNLSSIIEIESTYAESQFLIDKKEAIANLRLISEHEFLGSWKPKRITSRDSLAMHQGIWDPPHMRILAQVRSIKTTIADIAGLGEIAIQVASHTARQRQQRQRNILSSSGSSNWSSMKSFSSRQTDEWPWPMNTLTPLVQQGFCRRNGHHIRQPSGAGYCNFHTEILTVRNARDSRGDPAGVQNQEFAGSGY